MRESPAQQQEGNIVRTVPEHSPPIPLFTSYPPDAIVILAHKSRPRVTLNVRPDHWPLPIKNAFLGDPQWKNRAERHQGRLMHPLFTSFLIHRNPGAKALICCQDAHGGIVTIADAIAGVAWIGDRGENGSHAYLLLANEHRIGAPHGSIWGNYVLAISDIHVETPSMSIRDPHGTHFVETFMQNVVR